MVNLADTPMRMKDTVANGADMKRYFRQIIPREHQMRVQCNQVEDWEHCFLICSKYADLKIALNDTRSETYN